jgi:2,4-dienoyl-CoA reductase-like NADH-dependent reductase (Old Yellow Enzyme family)
MSHLFEPLPIRGLTLPNRIVMSPMCQYSSTDGFANEWHLIHLGSRAVGRAGLLITEAAAVTPDGRISPEDLGIWKDEHVGSLERITRFVHEQGAPIGIQLAHAGRKASTAAAWKGGKPIDSDQGGWSPIYGPSPIPFDTGYQIPHELTVQEIRSLVDAFRSAAGRSLAAGFEVVEVHAAHGYLLHEFLSSLSNYRRDEYGGSFENRIRFLCEVVSALREVWPERLPVFVRISATDWVPEGWDLDQSVELAKKLKGIGVDLIDCSSGGLVPHVRISSGPGYQTYFAEQIRGSAGILSAAVGMITSPHQADHIIRSGQADAVMLAREFLRQPYWPLRAAKILGQKINWPVQYERARD